MDNIKEKFTSIAEAIGQSSYGIEDIKGTTNLGLLRHGFRDKLTVLDAAGRKWTVYRNRKKRLYTCAHLSSWQLEYRDTDCDDYVWDCLIDP
jgi:hypothetical protein